MSEVSSRHTTQWVSNAHTAMRIINLGDAPAQYVSLSEDERRALRGSKFAPLPVHSSCKDKAEARVPHPGGPVATNKASALAKFLQRKLDTPSGSPSLNPVLVEAAVENAKATLSGLSSRFVKIRHVDTFSDSDKDVDVEVLDDIKGVQLTSNKKKRKKNKKKKQGHKVESAVGKAPFKKFKKL